jgi:hypothetical protein
MEGLGAFAQGFGQNVGPGLEKAADRRERSLDRELLRGVQNRRLGLEEEENKRKGEEHKTRMEILSRNLKLQEDELLAQPTPAERKAAAQEKLLTEMEQGKETREGIARTRLTRPSIEDVKAAEEAKVKAVAPLMKAETRSATAGAEEAEGRVASQLPADKAKQLVLEKAAAESAESKLKIALGEEQLTPEAKAGRLKEVAARVRLLESQAISAEDLNSPKNRAIRERQAMAEVLQEEAKALLAQENTQPDARVRRKMKEDAEFKILTAQAMMAGETMSPENIRMRKLQAQANAEKAIAEGIIAAEKTTPRGTDLRRRAEEAEVETAEARAERAKMEAGPVAKRLMAAQAGTAEAQEGRAVQETIEYTGPDAIESRRYEMVQKRRQMDLLIETSEKQLQGIDFDNNEKARAYAKALQFDMGDPEKKAFMREALSSAMDMQAKFMEAKGFSVTQDEVMEFTNNYMNAATALYDIGGKDALKPGGEGYDESLTVMQMVMQRYADGDEKGANAIVRGLAKAKDEIKAAASTKAKAAPAFKPKLTPEWGRIAERAGIVVTPGTRDADLVYDPKFRERYESATGRQFTKMGNYFYVLPKNEKGDEIGIAFDNIAALNPKVSTGFFSSYGNEFRDAKKELDEAYGAYMDKLDLVPGPESLSQFKLSVTSRMRRLLREKPGAVKNLSNSPAFTVSYVVDALREMLDDIKPLPR